MNLHDRIRHDAKVALWRNPTSRICLAHLTVATEIRCYTGWWPASDTQVVMILKGFIARKKAIQRMVDPISGFPVFEEEIRVASSYMAMASGQTFSMHTDAAQTRPSASVEMQVVAAE